MASASVMMRQFPHIGVFPLQAWIALIVASLLLGLSLLLELDQAHLMASSRLLDFCSPLYFAVGAFLVGHGIVYKLLGWYPVSIVTPWMLRAPVLGSFFGVLLLDDRLGWRLVVGGAMTLVGVMMVSVHRQSR